MTADGRLTFHVAFDRIGRHHDVMPLNVLIDDGPAGTVAEQLLDAVYDYARTMCASHDVDALLTSPEVERARPLMSGDLDGTAGFITAGMHIAGRFTVAIERPEAEPLSQTMIRAINTNPFARRAFTKLAAVEGATQR
jgi:hypothetical protein